MSNWGNWSPEILDILYGYGCSPDVIREYDLDCQSIRIVRGVLRIGTPNGYLMLKKMGMTPQRAYFLFRATEHLYGGFHQIPRMIRNKYGDPYVPHESWVFVLSDWLPGREADFRKSAQLTMTAKSLANLHLSSQHFQCEAYMQEGVFDYIQQAEATGIRLREYYQWSQNQVETTPFLELFEWAYPYLNRMIQHTVELGKTEYYRRIVQGAAEANMLCHGLVSGPNCLIEGETVSFVDFAHCHIGNQIVDLGYLVTRYLPKHDWDFETGKSVIEAYMSSKELSKLDLHALVLYLCIPVVPVQIITHFFERARDFSEERFCAELQKSLIDEEGREEFVQYMIDTYGLDIMAPDFAYELNLDDEDDFYYMESSSFHAGFATIPDWQADLKGALSAADEAVKLAEAETEKKHPLETKTDAVEQAQAETASFDPTASSISFRDAKWPIPSEPTETTQPAKTKSKPKAKIRKVLPTPQKPPRPDGIWRPR